MTTTPSARLAGQGGLGPSVPPSSLSSQPPEFQASRPGPPSPTAPADAEALFTELYGELRRLAKGVEPPLLRKWEEQLAGYVRASFRATSLITVAGQIAGCIQKITTVAVLWVGAYRVIDGDLSIGQLIAFNMLSAQVTGPLLRLVNLWQEFQQVGISVQRLAGFLLTSSWPRT